MLPRACLALLASVLLQGTRIVNFENAPVCRDVSMFVVPLKSDPTDDYRFRLTIHNDSGGTKVLAPLVPTDWELDSYSPRYGWRWAGGGGLGPGRRIDSQGRYPEEQYIRLAPGKAFTKDFDRPDLFGDGRAPASHVAYRVLFTYWYEPAAGETKLGLLPCAIHGYPALFIGRPSP
jgi:hypothetical protein